MKKRILQNQPSDNFFSLTPNEELIVNTLKEKGDLDIDTLLLETKLLPAKAATILLTWNLKELSGVCPEKSTVCFKILFNV